MAPQSKPPLGRTVIALSAVSLLTDVSSEMIYPLIPAFLTMTLGVSAGFVGVIEGAAESVAALVKLASGWWSDRTPRRKPLVVAGYSLAAFARPLVALATSGWQVLGIRLVDRVGKGIRSAPRDALLADSAPADARGRAFGFHRAADNLGAVLGPLCAFVLLRWMGVPIRTVFWLAAIPAVLAVVVLVVAVRERGDRSRETGARPEAGAVSPADHSTAALGGRFWGVLTAVFVFTLGNSTDAFLLLRAAELGVPIAVAPLIWAALHVVKSVSNTPGGALSDRVGRRPVVLAGWLLYAAVYVGFALASAAWHAWALFMIYGLVFGLSEGHDLVEMRSGAGHMLLAGRQEDRGEHARDSGYEHPDAAAPHSAGTTSRSASARCRRHYSSGRSGIATGRRSRLWWGRRSRLPRRARCSRCPVLLRSADRAKNPEHDGGVAVGQRGGKIPLHRLDALGPARLTFAAERCKGGVDGPPVVRMVDAPHEPVGLKAVNELRDVGPDALHAPRDVAQRQWLVRSREEGEDGVLRQRELRRGERRLEPVLNDAPRVEQREHRLVAGRGVVDCVGAALFVHV